MKERLTGAIILVALIVLLVPELLTGPVRPGAAPAVNSGSPTSNPSEEPPLRSYTINLADDAQSRSPAPSSGPAMPQPNGPAQPAATQPDDAAPNNSPQASAPTPASPAPSAPVTSSPDTSVPAPSPKAAQSAPKATPRVATADRPSKEHSPPKSAPPAATPGNGWMVQLGVFASKENAEHLAREMKGKGFRASVSNVTGSSRQLYRVRVGPASDRGAAQELQSKLRAAGRAGTIVPYS